MGRARRSRAGNRYRAGRGAARRWGVFRGSPAPPARPRLADPAHAGRGRRRPNRARRRARTRWFCRGRRSRPGRRSCRRRGCNSPRPARFCCRWRAAAGPAGWPQPSAGCRGCATAGFRRSGRWAGPPAPVSGWCRSWPSALLSQRCGCPGPGAQPVPGHRLGSPPNSRGRASSVPAPAHPPGQRRRSRPPGPNRCRHSGRAGRC